MHLPRDFMGGTWKRRGAASKDANGAAMVSPHHVRYSRNIYLSCCGSLHHAASIWWVGAAAHK